MSVELLARATPLLQSSQAIEDLEAAPRVQPGGDQATEDLEAAPRVQVEGDEAAFGSEGCLRRRRALPDRTFKDNYLACRSEERFGRCQEVQVNLATRKNLIKRFVTTCDLHNEQQEPMGPSLPFRNALIADENLPIHLAGEIFDDRAPFAVLTTTWVSSYGEASHYPRDLFKDDKIRNLPKKPEEHSDCSWWRFLRSFSWLPFVDSPQSGFMKNRVCFGSATCPICRKWREEAPAGLHKCCKCGQADNSAAWWSCPTGHFIHQQCPTAGQVEERTDADGGVTLDSQPEKYVAQVLKKGNWLPMLAWALLGSALGGIDQFNNFIYMGQLFHGSKHPSMLVGFMVTWFVLTIELVWTCWNVAVNDMYRVPNWNELELSLATTGRSQPPLSGVPDNPAGVAGAQVYGSPGEPPWPRRQFKWLVSIWQALGFGGADATRPSDNKEIKSWAQKDHFVRQLLSHMLVAYSMVPSTLTDIVTHLHLRGQVGRFVGKNGGVRYFVMGNWNSEHHLECDLARFHHRTLPSVLFMKILLAYWQLYRSFADGLYSVALATWFLVVFKLVLLGFKLYRWKKLLQQRVSLRHEIVARWGSALRRRSMQMRIEAKPEDNIRELVQERQPDMDPYDFITKKMEEILEATLPDYCNRTGQKGDRLAVQLQRPAEGAENQPLFALFVLYLGTDKTKQLTDDVDFRAHLVEEWKKADLLKTAIEQSEALRGLIQSCRTGKELLEKELGFDLRLDGDIDAFPIVSGKMPDLPSKDVIAALKRYEWKDLLGVYVGKYLQHFADLKSPVRARRWLLLAELWVPRHRFWLWLLALLLTVFLTWGPDPWPVLNDLWHLACKKAAFSSCSFPVTALHKEDERQILMEQLDDFLLSRSATSSMQHLQFGAEAKKMSVEALRSLLLLVTNASE